MYKSGALKKGIKKSIEYAGQFKAVTPTGVKTYDNWLKGFEDTPSASLLRQKSFKEAFKKAIGKSKEVDSITRKDAFNATIKDFKQLKDEVIKSTKKARELNKSDILNNVGRTDFTNRMYEIRNAAKRMDGAIQEEKATEIMKKELIEAMTVDPKKQAESIRRTGYRTATLGDIFDVATDMDGKQVFLSRHDIDLNKNTEDSIYNFLKSNKIETEDGFTDLINNGDYRKLKLDDNILISEDGKFADLRDINDTRNRMIRSAATDFKIPFVGINPLRFFNLDTVGYKNKMFATLSQESINPGLTGKTGAVTLGQAEGFAGTRTFFSNGNIYRFNRESETFDLIEKNKELLEIRKNRFGISKEANSFRKQADLRTRQYEQYTDKDNVSAFTKIKSKVAKSLDLGFQGHSTEYGGFKPFEILNPSNYIEKASDKVIRKANLNKDPEKLFKDWYEKQLAKGFSEQEVSMMADKPKFRKDIAEVFGKQDKYQEDVSKAKEYVQVVISKRYSMRDALSKESAINIGEYFKQYLYGRNDLTKVNKGSLAFYNLFERMNQAFSPFGLALSEDSIGTTGDVIKNLLLKRFLPVYAGYQGLEYITYLSERNDGEDNIKKDVANVIASTDLAVRGVADKVGITSLFKKIKELTPGSDHLTEMPFIKELNLSNTVEEQAEWYREGMEAVRKGRYWDLGNTAYTGGKITHYEANWYRKIHADADFTKEKYGSRKEYFENAWFPTLTSPLAPIRHFITDRYHYDLKHYEDRPYLLTSPQFEDVPLIGPTLGATVGKLVKPQRKMHEEYWAKSEYVESPYSPEIQQNQTSSNPTTYSPELSALSEAYTKAIFPDGILEKAGRLIAKERFLYPSQSSEPAENKRVYTTGSGKTSIIDIGEYSDEEVQEQLSTRSVKRIPGIKTSIYNDDGSPKEVVALDDDIDIEELQAGADERFAMPVEAVNPNSLIPTLTDQYKDSTNVLGIYGFISNAFVTGDLGANQELIETSGYNYSFNKKFWEQNIGGLGGDISEIFRRLMQKRRTDVNYYNPVRNKMAEWLPGDEYFVDFKHGDPFGKIDRGEMRLPGEAYQRLWGVDIYDMPLDIEDLDKDSDYLYNAILHRNSPDMPLSEDTSLDNKRNTVKNRILSKWENEGYATVTNGTITDNENKISGTFDAMINDDDKNAMVMIKALTQEEFEAIKSGSFDNSDKVKLNYMLGATGTEHGYIRYVNMDDESSVVGPEGGEYDKSSDQLESINYKVDFDNELFNGVINNVNQAKDRVLQGINNGTIYEGELYSDMDKLRILGDIAPYSQNYADMLSVVSANPTEEEREEINKITDRVKKQKEPLRITPYKFKTANVESINTEITKIDGNSIYVNMNGVDRKVNFAGITGLKDPTDEESLEEEANIKRNLVEGAKVKLLVDGDELQRDKSKGIKAVVIDKTGFNVNKGMLKSGIVDEKEDDNSAPAIHARYSKAEIAFGSAWERFAHMDTMFHTKFLKVRSIKEEYERTQVYGKDFQDWSNPIKDYLIPTINTNINRPITGMLFGAMVGSMFGQGKFGKSIGAIAGAGVIGIGKLYKSAYELSTGETWVPKARRKERELTEYVDVLKYVKNQRLFNHYADASLEKEGFDVRAYLKEKELDSDERKGEIRELEKEKFDLKEKDSQFKDELEQKLEEVSSISDDKKRKKKKAKIEEEIADNPYSDAISEVNDKINTLKTYREIEEIPALALKALEYHDASEKTMYGYDSGEPLQNIISALPKKDRDAMKYLLKTPEEEREEMLKIAPKYLRRALQSAWGYEVDEKPELEEYFQEHQLPDENWEGWNPDINIDAIKTKLVNSEGLDNSEFNIWDDDIDYANSVGSIPLPSIDFQSNAIDIRNKLYKVLSGVGLDDVNINMSYGGQGMNMSLNIENDRRKEVEEKINRYR